MLSFLFDAAIPSCFLWFEKENCRSCEEWYVTCLCCCIICRVVISPEHFGSSKYCPRKFPKYPLHNPCFHFGGRSCLEISSLFVNAQVAFFFFLFYGSSDSVPSLKLTSHITPDFFLSQKDISSTNPLWFSEAFTCCETLRVPGRVVSNEDSRCFVRSCDLRLAFGASQKATQTPSPNGRRLLR